MKPGDCIRVGPTVRRILAIEGRRALCEVVEVTGPSTFHVGWRGWTSLVWVRRRIAREEGGR